MFDKFGWVWVFKYKKTLIKVAYVCLVCKPKDMFESETLFYMYKMMNKRIVYKMIVLEGSWK